MNLRFAVVVLLALAFGAGGCSLAGRSLSGYMDDKSITGSLRRRFTMSSDRSLAHVSVDTYDGTVYLTGVVDTPALKGDAERAAWRIEGVSQVINDVQVRRDRAPSPRSPVPVRSAILERLPGIARVDPGLPSRPDEAYDRTGRLVATIYTLTLRELAQSGFDETHPTSRPIDHVSILAVAPHADVPDEQYYVVLWHVSVGEAAALP